MSRYMDKFEVWGELKAANQEAVLVFPPAPRPGKVVFYRPEAALYVWSGLSWERLGSTAVTSYYYIPYTRAVAIADGGTMTMVDGLTLDGSVVLDGMLAEA